MEKDNLIKKITQLEEEVQNTYDQNARVLEKHQHFYNEVAAYLRQEEDKIRQLKESFVLEIQALRQAFSKLNSEYRQHLYEARQEWAKGFVFNINPHAEHGNIS